MMKKQGFTLIELLIVVAIIAILAAIAVPNFLEAQLRAKVVSVKADFRNIVVAMNAYAIDYNGKNPSDALGTSWTNDYLCFIPLTTPIAYMSSIPVNPFFDEKNTSARGGYSYWALKPSEEVKPDNQKPVFYSKALSIFWHITSTGPDRNPKYDLSTNQLSAVAVAGRLPIFINALYDPTNGTVSKGDLHACNRGVTN